MRGHWDRPAEMAEALRRGWIRTCDTAFVGNSLACGAPSRRNVDAVMNEGIVASKTARPPSDLLGLGEAG